MRVLGVLLLLATACSTITARRAMSDAPVGCCCAYGDCRERFTQEQCVNEGEFQGWTYAWHAGPCTDGDTYPARDRS